MKRFAIVLVIVALAYFIIFKPIPLLPFSKQQASAPVTEQVDQIKLEVGSMHTEVKLSDDDQVHAELKGRGSVNVVRSGNTVHVETRRPFTLFNWWNRTRLTVSIPRDYERALDFTIGSADLDFTAEPETTYTALTADVASGSMTAKNVTAEKTTITVRSGNARLNHWKTSSADLVVRSGNLKATDYHGGFNAQVNSGNLTMDVAKFTGSVKTTVRSGRARIHLPRDASFRLKGNANSGLIQCTLPLKEKGKGENTIEGVHGSGTYTFDATVNSGLLHIN
ncbi:DUF4097 family beta strand repeat-containing protein [Sporolactobacillus inulinus]|uniref:DUF4097 family beta strand repeat-containing protein n=1 Tax=Sporolactobacillus inulinus TaxID=2078 RepID=UPI000255BE62|nr:DUF4097 family beta strand repeat-containing protein [Sporolactobacillus inulinus]GEB78100.1 hypothetical protein SIN01_24450 [Sporolactobacillus inulinus]